MYKIAIFISGRMNCYENNLLHILNYLDNKYKGNNDESCVNLFISLNSIRDEYHIKMEETLKKYIKSIHYEIYNVPDNFKTNTHPETLMQIIDGVKQPYTNLSCFYNDMIAFELIEKYEKTHNTRFDIYCKLRSDMTFHNINNLQLFKDDNDKLVIHTCVPPCQIYFYGYKNTPMCISDAFVFCNYETMKIYVNTYNYILKQNDVRNGNYRINYEPCVTENLIDFNLLDTTDCNIITDKIINNNRNIIIDYFNCNYTLDYNRRSRDSFIETASHRINQRY